jgi:hypothetical protein
LNQSEDSETYHTCHLNNKEQQNNPKERESNYFYRRECPKKHNQLVDLSPNRGGFVKDLINPRTLGLKLNTGIGLNTLYDKEPFTPQLSTGAKSVNGNHSHLHTNVPRYRAKSSTGLEFGPYLEKNNDKNNDEIDPYLEVSPQTSYSMALDHSSKNMTPSKEICFNENDETEPENFEEDFIFAKMCTMSSIFSSLHLCSIIASFI